MKNINKMFLLAVATVTLLSACQKLDPNYDVLTKGFDPNAQANLVFLNGSMLYEVENNSVVDETISIELQVWGPLSANAATVDITVNTSASTAEAGKQYTLETTSVEIPANTGGAKFDIIMHSANFEKGDTVLLVLNLSCPVFKTSLPAATANLRLSKKPECPFDIKTFTGSYIANERGYGEYNVDFRADATDPYRVWQSNFWDYTSDLLAFDLDPLTGLVNVPEQGIVMGDGNTYLVVGSGTFDPCTGIMIVDFQGDVDGTHEEYRPGSVAKSAKLLIKKGK